MTENFDSLCDRSPSAASLLGMALEPIIGPASLRDADARMRFEAGIKARKAGWMRPWANDDPDFARGWDAADAAIRLAPFYNDTPAGPVALTSGEGATPADTLRATLEHVERELAGLLAMVGRVLRP